jgi:hypothetical protein
MAKGTKKPKGTKQVPCVGKGNGKPLGELIKKLNYEN